MLRLKLARLGLIGILFVFLISSAFAWGFAYTSDTWNSNQVYAGSFFVSSSPYSGWTYNAYRPSSGYPLLGGGHFYPNGYFSGNYAVYPSFGYGNSYSGYPFTTAYSYGVGAPVHYTSDSYGYNAHCNVHSYYGC